MKSNLHAVYGLSFVPVDDVSIVISDGPALNHHWLGPVSSDCSFHHMLQIILAQQHRLSIIVWNYYDSTLSDSSRTNSFSEGSKNALNTAAGCSNPIRIILRPMDILRRFNAEVELKIVKTYRLAMAYKQRETTEHQQGPETQRESQEKCTGHHLANIATYCYYLHEWTFEYISIFNFIQLH